MMMTFKARAASAFAGCLAATLLPGAHLWAQDGPESQEPEIVWRGRRMFQANEFRLLEHGAEAGLPYAVAVQRGRALVAEGRHAEAAAAFGEAARLDRCEAPYDEWGDALEAAGDVEGAVAAYLQAVYRSGDKARDWVDGDGRSVRAAVLGKGGGGAEEWTVARGASTALTARYALLLSRAGRRAEALRAYEWAWRRLEEDRLLRERLGLAEALGGLDAPQPPGGLRGADRGRFEATLHTLVGLTEGVMRTRRSSLWPGEAAVGEYKKALAARPDHGPALLLLGEEYLKKEGYAKWYRPAAVQALRAAVKSGPPSVRARAREKLEALARGGAR